MNFPSSAIIIIIVIGFALYLIYSQHQQPKYVQMPYQVPHQMPSQNSHQMPLPNKENFCPNCHRFAKNYQNSDDSLQMIKQPPQPQITNLTIDNGNGDPYSDAIKKQDLYTMYDPLTYPQLRLPREVLDRYNEYYEKTGTYPPFNQATQPFLFDNPILNGLLIKECAENEPFSDNVPSAIPLFRVKSAKNANRFFYYIIDQRYLSKIEPKIPLDHIKVNGVRFNNSDFYGIPELFDGDHIEHISIYPMARFTVQLYKTYHFP